MLIIFFAWFFSNALPVLQKIATKAVVHLHLSNGDNTFTQTIKMGVYSVFL
jgi:hypothetical protein